MIKVTPGQKLPPAYPAEGLDARAPSDSGPVPSLGVQFYAELVTPGIPGQTFHLPVALQPCWG